MSFEPQKFFVGLIDFFAIIMPGALLVYFTRDVAAAWFARAPLAPLDGAEGAAVFLFASYLLGHFAFLLGAVLDEWFYDPLRKLTELGQIKRLSRGKRLSSPWLRTVAGSDWLFGGNPDAAVTHALRLKASALAPLSANSAINAYQWCKARLGKEHPEGLLEVHRFEANSKFFRSFVVVLLALAVFYLLQHNRLAVMLCVIAVAPALWRYIDQRFKATQQAYWHVLTLESSNKSKPAAPPRDDGLTHAGGVVYRLNRSGEAMYLLVQSSKNRKEWVLPKGHIELGEDPREAAVREVLEEAGHWAFIEKWLEDSRLSSRKDAPHVRWFMMRCDEEGRNWPPENRQHQWFPLDEARRKATFPETRELLAIADQATKDARKLLVQLTASEKGTPSNASAPRPMDAMALIIAPSRPSISSAKEMSSEFGVAEGDASRSLWASCISSASGRSAHCMM